MTLQVPDWLNNAPQPPNDPRLLALSQAFEQLEEIVESVLEISEQPTFADEQQSVEQGVQAIYGFIVKQPPDIAPHLMQAVLTVLVSGYRSQADVARRLDKELEEREGRGW